MNEHEAILLRRFAQMGDADAFAEITRLYAGMVYGVCLRVTGDAEHARDATQDTFFQLLKSAGQVSGSLGGWLHQVATRRAVDLIRRDSARRQREQTFATDTLPETDAWSDVSPLVDEAMNEIEPEQRDLLLRHFLQGETTVQLAAAVGLSQPTMSRRVAAALEQLRQRLHGKGIGVSAALLAAMMAGAPQSAPAAVLAELGKMALVTPAAMATATFLGIKAKLAIAAVVVALLGSGWLAYHYAHTPAAVSHESVGANGRAGGMDFGGIADPAAGPRLAVVRVEGGARGGWIPYGDPGSNGQPPRFGGMAMGAAGPNPMTTPRGALTRFTARLLQGDPSRAADCFAGSTEAESFQRLWEHPENERERNLQTALRSLIPPVEVLETNSTEAGLRFRWTARVRQPFTLVENGATNTWQTGDRFETAMVLKQIANEWRIVGF